MRKINLYLVVFTVGIFSFLANRSLFSSEKSKKDAFVFSGQACEKLSEESDSEEKQNCSLPELSVEKNKVNQELAEKAINVCFRGKIPKSDKFLKNALTLLEAEDDNGVPPEMKGMTLAAACIESGFSERAEGDHWFSRDKKTPMAIGILQLWPLYERAYKVDRRDVKSSANGWLVHIKKQIKYVKARCKTQSEEQTWKIAWVTGVRAPKAGGRCHETISHWSMFKKIKTATVPET